jgi:hypothetical protein
MSELRLVGLRYGSRIVFQADRMPWSYHVRPSGSADGARLVRVGLDESLNGCERPASRRSNRRFDGSFQR